MLQVRHLDLPICHHYQDRSDTIELLEMQDEIILFLAPFLREHIFNKYTVNSQFNVFSYLQLTVNSQFNVFLAIYSWL